MSIAVDGEPVDGTRYEPDDPFLRAVVAEAVSLSDGPEAAANLARLIALTTDRLAANRDWATMLLALEDADTPDIRHALLHAAGDPVDAVRAEAILGLARRDPALALPLVRDALAGHAAPLPLFEAAVLCADLSLIADLRVWAEPSGQPLLDATAAEALAACEAAAGPA